MSKRRGAGDPARTFERLWRVPTPARPGPSPGRDLSEIVTAAIAIADQDGLEALSMRSLAGRLELSPMSVYNYVSNKAELLDLMCDAVLAQLPEPRRPSDGWRSDLSRLMWDLWELYGHHPWTAFVAFGRAELGPGTLDVTERILSSLSAAGLSNAQMLRAVDVITVFVHGAARALSDVRAAVAATGQTDDEWWTEREPLRTRLAELVDMEARYPTLTSLDTEDAFDRPDRDGSIGYLELDVREMFEFGMERLLDGLEAAASTDPSHGS